MSDTETRPQEVAPLPPLVEDHPAFAAIPASDHNPTGELLKYHVGIHTWDEEAKTAKPTGASTIVFARTDEQAIEEARQIWLSRHGMAATDLTRFTVETRTRPGFPK